MSPASNVLRIGLDKLVACTLIWQQSRSSSRRSIGKQCRADNSAENSVGCVGKRKLKFWVVVAGLTLKTAWA
jgi:hypothetical protein